MPIMFYKLVFLIHCWLQKTAVPVDMKDEKSGREGRILMNVQSDLGI